MTTDSVKPRFKEQTLVKKYEGVKEEIPIHQVQYAFETQEREDAFISNMFPTGEERGRYKAYREEWHRRPKENDAADAPLAVCCELVSTCNLACSMCYTISDDFENAITGAQRMLPWPIVKKVIDECAELGVASLLLSWRGEPTLYRWRKDDEVITFPDVVKYAREQGILEITAITHGQEIDATMADAIVEAEPSWISFSIDGQDDDYNKIRTPRNQDPESYDAFSVVMANIKNLAEARNRAGKTRPQIRSNAIFPAISRDPDGYRQRLMEAGVDMLTVNELLDLRAGELEEEARAEKWGCQYPFQRLTVSANGIILPCTGAYLEQSGLVLGHYTGTPSKTVRNADGSVAEIDVPEMTLKEAWHSAKLNSIRDLHQGGRRCEINPGCRDCNHGAKKHGVDRLPEEWDLESQGWKSQPRRG